MVGSIDAGGVIVYFVIITTLKCYKFHPILFCQFYSTMKYNTNYYLIIITLLCIILTLQLISLGLFRKKVQFKKPNQSNPSNGQCSKNTCGAIDDVNNPAYNMKNVIKQSILLEEHIAEKNKYCLSCIVKHFNHIIGLCEEGVWLAEKDVSKYPYLEDSVSFYQHWFDKWVKARQDNNVKSEVLGAIRERRRALIDSYYLI